MGRYQKSAKIWLSMSIFNIRNHPNLFQLSFLLKNINLGAHFLLLTFLITSIYKSLHFLKWCLIFDTLPSTQFSKFNNFLWVCCFFCKNLSNFVPPAWKLHYLTCHILYSQTFAAIVMRNYGMNQTFEDNNPERIFQAFDDEKNSHLQIKIGWSKAM